MCARTLLVHILPHAFPSPDCPDLKASKEFRPLTIQGSGADHVMHVVSLRGGQELQLQGVRLLAEAALHDDTETAFFNKGAVEAAMRIGREVAWACGGHTEPCLHLQANVLTTTVCLHLLLLLTGHGHGDEVSRRAAVLQPRLP